MPSIFQSPRDMTSSVESSENDPPGISHVQGEGTIGDAGLTSERAESQNSKQPDHEDVSALKTGPVARLLSTPSMQAPNLPSLQHHLLLHLSFIDQRCKSTAAAQLNASRDPQDKLSEDHPDVVSLAQRLYEKMSKELINSSGLPDDITGAEGAAFRDAYSSGFDELLSRAAAKELRELESSSSPKDNATTVAGFPSFPPGNALSKIDGVGFTPSLMLGENKNPWGPNSVYSNEYEEMSLLGKGAYGKVFKVRSYLDNQEYAVKKIVIPSRRLQRSLEQDQIEALLAEVHTLAKLSHTNIVRYFHAWIEHQPSGFQTKKIEPSERSTNHRIIEGFETQETSSGYEATESLRLEDLRDIFEQERNETMQQMLETAVHKKDDDDNIIFEYSSATHGGESCHNHTQKRRASHATTSSNITFKTSMLSVGEDDGDDDDDPDIETIPRTNTDGDSFPLSKSEPSRQVPARRLGQAQYLGPDIILCIKMSLHPMTLSTYLSWEPPIPNDTAAIRHCFHQDPSIDILASILDGIEYIHSQKIVHRDLKPANIFLSVQKDRIPALSGCVDIMACSQCMHDNAKHVYVTPCIGDFGLIAELAETVASSESIFETPSTFKPSQLAALRTKPVGTPFYRPSAMPKDEPRICTKLDIYSLGVIALELIQKFGTKSERATVLTDLKKGVLPREFEDHVVADGIKGMVCEDRHRRWDCSAVRKWLESVQGKGKHVS